jgi:transposase
MTTLPDVEHSRVTGGVDTHKDAHVAAVLDHLGRIMATQAFPTTAKGYAALLRWMRGHGTLDRVGVEGTGTYGAGLCRYLVGRGVEVIEVNRPNRQRRRLRGKSDPTDAEAAARAVLAGEATAQPKGADGAVEAIRALRVARRSAVKARTQAANQMLALVVTAPDRLRQHLNGLAAADLAAAAARFRRHPDTGPTEGTKLALRSLARRWQALDAEIAALDADLTELLAHVAPPGLLAKHGVGTDVAGALLVAAGDHPERLGHQGSFAALCGASPVDASSGKHAHHRLNQGGDRQANSALWRIVMVRMRDEPRTQAYVKRRTAEGKTTKEIQRCLKRYVAREIYNTLAPKTPRSTSQNQAHAA